MVESGWIFLEYDKALKHLQCLYRHSLLVNAHPCSFPAAFFMNRMEDVFSVMKKAEPKETVKCESCSRFPAVDFCHDCNEFICNQCADAHKHMKRFSSHKVVSITSLRSSISKSAPEKLQVVRGEVKCSKHTDEPLKLFCHDCHKLVCRDCIVIDHKDHRYAFVVDAAPLCKAEIRGKAEKVRVLSEGLKAAVKLLSDSEKQLSAHETATVRAIDDALDRVAEQLVSKRKELKKEASRMVSSVKEKVSAQEKGAQLAVRGGESAGVHEPQSRESHRSGGAQSGETDVRSGGQSLQTLWQPSRQVPSTPTSRVGGTLWGRGRTGDQN